MPLSVKHLPQICLHFTQIRIRALHRQFSGMVQFMPGQLIDQQNRLLHPKVIQRDVHLLFFQVSIGKSIFFILLRKFPQYHFIPVHY